MRVGCGGGGMGDGQRLVVVVVVVVGSILQEMRRKGNERQDDCSFTKILNKQPKWYH